MRRTLAGGIVLCISLFMSTAARSAPADDRDRQIQALEDRIRRLEQRVEKLEKSGGEGAPARDAKLAEAIDDHQAKARQRMAQDLKKYSRDELRQAESLYQVANKDWGSEDARKSLEKMIEKYPDVNRTGCAIVYLAQYAEGNEKQKLLSKAIADHSDCYYLNGVQVGAWARYLLGLHLQETGHPDEAKKLFDEIRKDYPDAVDHGKKDREPQHWLVDRLPKK